MTTYLTLLRNRPSFRFLWIAQVISLGGDWFNAIATVILVNRYTDSTTAVGGLFLARALPPFLLGPLAGVIADRFPRKMVIIITNALRVLIVSGFLLVDSPSEAWLIYALTILQFSVSAFFEPASAAIMPTLVEGDELLVANTLSNITWSSMLTLGAALGGFTAALVGVQAALVIDALTFAAAALLMLGVHAPHIPPATAHHSTGWRDFREGLNFLVHRPQLGMVALVKGMGQIGNVDIIIALYAKDVFPIGEDGALTIGLMLAVHGLGAVLGPLVANQFGDGSTAYLKRAILGGYGSYIIAWLIIGGAPWLPLAMIGSLLRGMGGSVNWTYSSVILQRSTPDQYMGRVFGLDFTFFTLGMAISVWFTGVAVDAFSLSPREVVFWLALLCLIPFILWGVYLRNMPLETQPEPATPPLPLPLTREG